MPWVVLFCHLRLDSCSQLPTFNIYLYLEGYQAASNYTLAVLCSLFKDDTNKVQLFIYVPIQAALVGVVGIATSLEEEITQEFRIELHGWHEQGYGYRSGYRLFLFLGPGTGKRSSAKSKKGF
ncbi:Aste57867_16691 [Aphanomyces stellatus]|uniref:Aste57867_16691 protein n=1 Tax=Aphanomyces stellatus TaxID=120398 RepID=A0A485L7M1_9STRA|nr:hypothetical protein As57867_016634 [Aphanomyces stellatus]VFT93461.1 Aste57867_16691 [Aphanomyces stellatus]